MNDPRAENCRGFTVNAEGKVTGVYLEVQPVPGARYALLRAELIDEVAAQGNIVATCAVLDANGIQTAENVYLAWPYPNMTDKALPGNPSNQHMITNGYTPPEVGPLALYVGDANGAPISDIIGGLGLPYNRHVCFRATWRERGAQQPPTDPTPGEVGGAVADLLMQNNVLLGEILAAVKAGFRL